MDALLDADGCDTAQWHRCKVITSKMSVVPVPVCGLAIKQHRCEARLSWCMNLTAYLRGNINIDSCIPGHKLYWSHLPSAAVLGASMREGEVRI